MSVKEIYHKYKTFTTDWLSVPIFKGWLQEVSKDPTSAYCKYCRCVLRAHRSDLETHRLTRKHKKWSIKYRATQAQRQFKEMKGGVKIKQENENGEDEEMKGEEDLNMEMLQDLPSLAPKGVTSRIVSAVLLKPLYQADEELILKVRVANDEAVNDFLEVELPRSDLTCCRLLQVCADTLNVEPAHVERIRKLPNTVIHRDKEVRRLEDYQELELVMSGYVIETKNLPEGTKLVVTEQGTIEAHNPMEGGKTQTIVLGNIESQ